MGVKSNDSLETSSSTASVDWGAGIRRGAVAHQKGACQGLRRLLFPPKQRIFFSPRKKFPIPSVLSCGFSLVRDTSPLYLASPLPCTHPPTHTQNGPRSQDDLQVWMHLSVSLEPPQPTAQQDTQTIADPGADQGTEHRQG